jgi:flagellar biosynthesis protein FliP
MYVYVVEEEATINHGGEYELVSPCSFIISFITSFIRSAFPQSITTYLPFIEIPYFHDAPKAGRMTTSS